VPTLAEGIDVRARPVVIGAMMNPSSSDPHDRSTAQLARIEARVGTAWGEYLAMTRASDPRAYVQTETFAWRRLRRSLAELAGDRRRVDFEVDRRIAESRGTRRAA
jgi:hypothetical protein